MLVVGIPKEIKPQEKRVGLNPAAVSKLTAEMIPVIVQSGAGAASGYSDEDYTEAGAQIVPSIEDVYEHAQLIQKVKEPQREEYALIRNDHILFGFLHLASPEHCDLVHCLRDSGATALAYETLVVNRRTPVLKPMSEIAGGLSAAFGAYFLSQDVFRKKDDLRPGDLLPALEKIAASYPVPPAIDESATAVIFGAGAAGENASDFLLDMGFNIVLVDKSEERLDQLRDLFGDDSMVELFLPEEFPEEILDEASLLIGAVHVPGSRAFKVVERDAFERASDVTKKVVMDIAIDQGGNFPESRPTTYDNPVYFDSWGNLRFAVPNIPALCGKSASDALSEATLAYTMALARGREWAFKEHPELLTAVNVRSGHIENEAVKEAHKLTS